MCIYKLENVETNLNIVRDDIENLQKLFDFSKSEMEFKLLETSNAKTKANLENMVEKCKDTGHNICKPKVSEVTEHNNLEKSIRNLEEVIKGHNTTIEYQEASIKKHEELIERRTSKENEKSEEVFRDSLEDLSLK